MVTMRRGTLAPGLALALLMSFALPMAVAADEASDIAAAKAGTEAYQDVSQAEADGYGLPPEGPLHECISSLDDSGGMGLHYINGDRVGDTALDPATPEVLVYAPDADGDVVLVALEYVVFAEAWDAENDAPPTLFEREFMLVDEPNRYELPAFYALHAWVWKENRSGTFADFNPEVTCPAGAVPDTALGMPVTANHPGIIGLAALLVTLVIAGVGAARRPIR